MQVKTEKARERWAGLLAAVLLVLVCTMGFLVYHKLSAVTNPAMSGQPRDIRLLLLKELNADLIRAENYVFAYSLKEENHMAGSFEHIRKKTEMRLRQLRRFPSGDKHYLGDIDSLTSVVKKRFAVMELMMATRNETRVDAAMTQVIDEVQELAAKKKNSVQKTVVYKPAPVKTQAAKPVVSESKQEPAKKKKLFSRLSSKKKEEKENEKQKEAAKEPETIVAEEQEPQMIPEVVTTRTSPAVNVNLINRELNQIRNDVVLDELRTNEGKLALEKRNNWLVERFTQLLQTIENKEKQLLQQQAETAKQAAEETNLFMVLFCVISVLLIGLVAYLIVTLLQKIRRTNTQLVMAKERSDQLTESKSRFLANMSHEIRTPLNAITGYADQLQSQQLPGKQREMVDVIQRSAWHLSHITNDILDLSRVHSGTIQLESVPVALSEELDFMLRTFKEKAAASGNTFTTVQEDAIPPYLLTDPLRLRQVLFNLIGNAIKFTENGSVKLAVHLEDKKGDQCTLRWEISDTGIGIEPDKIDRIFEEFEQAEITTTRRFGGTGLGLAITRNLVQIMGGTVSAKSEPGKGSVFSVVLPFKITEQAPQTATRATEQSWENSLAGKRILLVDDEVYNRKLLVNMLQFTGATFEEAEHGGEAIKLISIKPYDLVLLDLRMPVMDGFQVLEILRNSEIWSDLPVVALTAGMEAGERDRMQSEGWTDVVQKPLKKEQLFAILAEVFNLDATLSMQNVPAEETQPLSSHTLPIDFASLRDLSGNDKAFYTDMLETFRKTTAEGLSIIKKAVENSDWSAMAEAAHKIAPPVKHMQGYNAYELLKQLENAGRTTVNTEEVTTALAELEQLLKAMLILVEEEISATGKKIAG